MNVRSYIYDLDYSYVYYYNKYEKTWVYIALATATEYLSDNLVLQPKLSLKTSFPARFNSHVTSHVIHEIDE